MPKASKMMSLIRLHEPTPPGIKDKITKSSKRILIDKKILPDPGIVLTRMMLKSFKRMLLPFVRAIVILEDDNRQSDRHGSRKPIRAAASVGPTYPRSGGDGRRKSTSTAAMLVDPTFELVDPDSIAVSPTQITVLCSDDVPGSGIDNLLFCAFDVTDDFGAEEDRH